ncbi:MAG TPA: MBOAT family protein [Candidatus Scatavimonas merdigallinarum]|uniref:MBOAT family protein n=1 Tax=Candidatus Scatavimonas merdigallinarum TaxID=2840914 RepID=A0A9D0ZJN4_9FIRM|nr:MBOAT family protein [Candidatus Scatavimonas merdigallinarum]
MVFSSLLFLFLYLPAVILIYYVTPCRYRNLFLFVVNLIFYGWGEPVFVLLMLFSTLVDYTHGYFINKYRQDKKVAKRFLVSAVVINLGLLGFFKYAGFLTETLNVLPFLDIAPLEIPLPIGISFYTFQTMSYSIDVYRGDAPVQKNIIAFGTYVTLFPQLIAGPIVRYKDVAEQLDHRKETLADFTNGVKLFMVGLAKKVLLANQMGLLWDQLRGTSQENGVLGSWIGICAYAFQIYFDFSGYSDMARGLGNMFGFEFLKNFDYPYISKTITEFWRRWHISLGTWFREYVYIPLGGNRKGTRRMIINLLIVWFLTGLWHGASVNFILWGLYFGVILIIEKLFLMKYLQKLPAALQHIYSLFLIVIGWVIFYFEDMQAMGQFFIDLFNPAGGVIGQEALVLVWSYLPLLAAAVLASTPLAYKLYEKIKYRNWCWIPETTLCAAALLICTATLVSQSYNPFIYFRF